LDAGKESSCVGSISEYEKNALQIFPWDFSLGRIEVESTEMEQDVGLEALPVAIPVGFLD
jgi:hypothetical protein